MIVFPNGSATFFGLGTDGRMYQYLTDEERWVSLKEEKIRRDLIRGQEIASKVESLIKP